MKLFSFLCIVLTSMTLALEAGTVRLFNDSAYKLRAVIRGADGTYLGEMVITPQSSSYWTDSVQQFGHSNESNSNLKNSARSQTPYTVIWYCMDGSDYSVSDNIGTGAFTQAQQGTGRRTCGAAKTPDVFKDSQGENILPQEDTTRGPGQ